AVDAAELTADVEHQRRAAHDQARTALAEAIDLQSRQRRHAAAQADQHRLADAAREHLARRERRDLALRAAPVAPLLDAVTRTADGVRVAAERRQAADDALSRVAPHLESAQLDQVVRHDEQIIGQLSLIANLLDDELTLAGREHQLIELDHQRSALTEQRHQLALARDAVPAERARLDQRLAAARESSSRLGDLAQLESQLATRQQAAVERDRLVTLVDDHAEETTRRRADALDARERWLGLLQTQLESRAAAMAADLAPGDACPVCGSADHPQLATGEGPLISDDEVAEARTRADQAEQHLQVALESATELDHRLTAAVATAGDLGLDEVTAELAELRSVLAEARADASAEPDLQSARDRLDDQIERMAQLLDDADRELAAINHARELMGAGLEADRLRITDARAGFDTLAERVDALQATRDAIAMLVEADQELTHAEQLHTSALAAAEDEARHRSFAGLDQARAAVLDDDQLRLLTASIEAHDRSVAETDATLADPELVAAAAAPPAEVEQLRALAHTAERDWDVASTAAAAARGVVDKLRRARDELDEHLVRLGPLADTHERTRRLADLACGDDRQVEHRMRLSTYVLAARLEQVAAAASERLSRMSGGRFTIVHTDEAPDGRRKGGLGLRVVDAWTSTHRETASLSGGESFFTSLALALGVADVVSAEAGGITIDTMFIDEGFGSLDEDTLQQVLDVIDGLRAGGRTIGIVSHVADLRDRITTQLEVIKGPDGSSLRTTAPSRTQIGDIRFDRGASASTERPSDQDPGADPAGSEPGEDAA
ncbi:MAG: SbcC/MukB-like Walker B domain-containing protein, partial [Acidimicrobiales bacterium]